MELITENLVLLIIPLTFFALGMSVLIYSVKTKDYEGIGGCFIITILFGLLIGFVPIYYDNTKTYAEPDVIFKTNGITKVVYDETLFTSDKATYYVAENIVIEKRLKKSIFGHSMMGREVITTNKINKSETP